MPGKEIRFNLRYYKTASGNEPVKEGLNELAAINPAYTQEIMADLRTLQIGYPRDIPRKLCKHLRDGLFECRTHLPGHNIARVIFCVSGAEIFLLEGFIKKTQETPPQKIDLALKRKRELNL
jgi:phage-related protein